MPNVRVSDLSFWLALLTVFISAVTGYANLNSSQLETTRAISRMEKHVELSDEKLDKLHDDSIRREMQLEEMQLRIGNIEKKLK